MTDDFRKLFRIPAATCHWGTDCQGPEFFRKQYVMEELDELISPSSRFQSPVHRITPRWAHYTGSYRFAVLDVRDAGWLLSATGPGDGAYYATIEQPDGYSYGGPTGRRRSA